MEESHAQTAHTFGRPDMAGRKPLPTQLKLIKGTATSDGRNPGQGRAEPVVQCDLPADQRVGAGT